MLMSRYNSNVSRAFGGADALGRGPRGEKGAFVNNGK